MLSNLFLGNKEAQKYISCHNKEFIFSHRKSETKKKTFIRKKSGTKVTVFGGNRARQKEEKFSLNVMTAFVFKLTSDHNGNKLTIKQ